jgi:phosphoglycerol transferase MdoB-like AlkP superfamily enzyme
MSIKKHNLHHFIGLCDFKYLKPMQQKFNAIYFPIRLIFFYIIGLNIWRFIFIYYNEVEDVFLPVWKALRLDLSMACGAFLLSFLPWILFLILGYNWLRESTRWITGACWVLICLVEFGSILIFPEWGTSLDARAVSYLLHPSEAWASSKDFISWPILFISVFILFAGLKRLNALFVDWRPIRAHYAQSIVFLFLIGPISFVGLRGGIQKLPIKPSDGYYSTVMKNNFAACNKTWYLLYSLKKQAVAEVINSQADIEHFKRQYMVRERLQDTVTSSFHLKNIVFIITEGWSADMVAYLGSKENVTPFFDSLANHSFRFTNMYSTGFRTDQGLMSLLSGIPSIGSLNMPNQLDKVTKFPSLTAMLKQAGYRTSFIYGGDLNFSNLYNYLAVSGFDTIISQRSFDGKDNTTDWGVPDHITVQKAARIQSLASGPFFSTILLLSSHSPFDNPIANDFTGRDDIPSKYKSSVKYSDDALRLYFDQIRNKEWYANTIFIITSDHGSTHSGVAKMDDHQRFHIPFLVFSPSSIPSADNQELTIPANHFDLPFTMLLKLGLNTDGFVFGRNIFSPDSSRSAYWNHDYTAAYTNIKDHEMVKTNTRGHHATLFFDMVRTWYNKLTINN